MIYYRLDTTSTTGEDTNLQLYALYQTKKYWQALTEEYAADGEETEQLKEKCVFVVACMGLSVSQLLGQNNPSVSQTVPYPKKIFNTLVDEHNLDPCLKQKFEEFNNCYNGCRHFGATLSSKGYQRVNELTFLKAKEYYEYGMEVWKTIISIYKDNDENEIHEDIDKIFE